MLDAIQACFKAQFQFSHFAALVQRVGEIANIVQTDYTKDKDAKNAAIDALCAILQGFKDAAPVQPQQPSGQ